MKSLSTLLSLCILPNHTQIVENTLTTLAMSSQHTHWTIRAGDSWYPFSTDKEWAPFLFADQILYRFEHFEK